MGNEVILTLAHEARIRFLQSLGYSEMDVEGRSIILLDATIRFQHEAFQGDRIRMRLGIEHCQRHGFDMIYQAVNDNTGTDVARLKTGIVFFDYVRRKISPLSAENLAKFNRVAAGGTIT